MEIGRIVTANSHLDYVAQVYGPSEAATVPTPEDYSFGTFTLIRAGESDGDGLVAVVYDTLLVNPDFGRQGPRLSPPGDVGVFAPDYLNEQATLVGLAVLGRCKDGACAQGVPRVAAQANAPVVTMDDAAFARFHRDGGSVALRYAPILQAQGKLLLSELLQQVVRRLEDAFPARAEHLRTLRANLLWQSRVEAQR